MVHLGGRSSIKFIHLSEMRKRRWRTIAFATRMNIYVIYTTVCLRTSREKGSFFSSFCEEKKVDCHRASAVDKVITFWDWSDQKRPKRELRSGKCYPNKIITLLNNLKCEKILFHTKCKEETWFVTNVRRSCVFSSSRISAKNSKKLFHH